MSVVGGLAAGGVLLVAPLVGVVEALAGEAAVPDEGVSDVSFLSAAAAGAFSPSDGGFSLLE
ncbi:MAG TPA: hypothetical protein VLE25_12805 [Nitrospira sp.]|nr:hypothetical protein [Nitrospira sp.]